MNGPRGVDYDDPTGGDGGNHDRFLSTYNLVNWFPVTSVAGGYERVYAFGAYLARSYGGAPLFGDIVRNDRSGIQAIEAGLAGSRVTWSLSRNCLRIGRWPICCRTTLGHRTPTATTPEPGVRPNPAVGVTFRLGSINLFNYRYWFGDGPNDYHDGPYFFSLRSHFNGGHQQFRYSNRYADLSLTTGPVRLRVDAVEGNRITVVVKE